MKFLTITFIIFFSLGSSFAQEVPTFRVLERRAWSNKVVYKKVRLENLESSSSFEGKHFRVVKGKSDSAIEFGDSDKELLLKAATVYHHLTLARKFWVEKMSSIAPESLEKVTVRLEITNLFDEQGHFAHDNRSPQYNNALSIPGGETPPWVPAEKQKRWQKEIWFRPMKKVETKDLPGMGPNPLTASLKALEQPFINYTRNQFNQSLIEHIFYPSYAPNPLWMDVIRFAGTIALTKAVIEGSKYADKFFVEKYYYLDTALVPEVIYHEYAHLILSDSLEMTHSTPVVEGMADYFAAALAKKKRIYAPVKGHSNSAAKSTQNRQFYSHWYESNRAATSDFVLSVLWDVRDTVGEEVADDLVYEARKKLSTGAATINQHLIQAVLDACSVKCLAPNRDKLLLYEAFAKKGF